MDPQDLKDLNELIHVKNMDLDLADDIDEYVRSATWTPKEVSLLKDMIKPWGNKHILTAILFDDDDIRIEDGHDLVKEFWKIATQRPLDSTSEHDEAYRCLIRYYNQAIGALDTKFNKVPTLIGSKNKLVATIAKWRLNLGR
jgi:hypothetical protein